MATQEKLQKSLEALKNLSGALLTPDPARNKEKKQHCYNVTEAFSNPTIKVSSNFQLLLGVTIEIFLKLCDDPDSDIRMTSDECLNRIIRAVSDGHIGKVQIKLHNEIERNGAARTLRAALVRFAQLAHHIKPQKGAQYVTYLFPSIVKITERSEELIHETLAMCVPKIMMILGCFASDGEIKLLLKAFLKNVTNSSPAIRRSASSCLLNICSHSRRPYVFVTYCVNILIDMIVPVDECKDNYTILGVLHSLKLLIPSLRHTNGSGDGFSYSKDVEVIQPLPLNKLLQIYELCLYFIINQDHNIINASLETLNSLLSNITSNIKDALLSPSGIDKYRIHKSKSISNMRSPSQISVATNTTTEENVVSELTDTVAVDIEKWIGESKLSVINIPHVIPDEKRALNESGSVDMYNEEKHPETFGLKRPNLEESIDKISDHSSEKSVTESGSIERLLDYEVQEIDVGTYLDKDTSLLYCTRVIVKCFLLCGVPGKYINDKIVRVSVKSSALTCLSAIFRIYPEVFFKYLDKSYSTQKVQANRVSAQKISDIMLFCDHPDPQLRGATRIITSDLVQAILTEGNLNFEKGIKKMVSDEYHDIKEFISVLTQGLRDETLACLKQTLLSLNPTLILLSESRSCYEIIPILKALPLVANNPYWLVKVTLCELVSKISFVTIFHITGNSLFQNKVLNNVLFEFLKDSDQRIRTAASISLSQIIQNLYFEENHPTESPATTKATRLSKNLGFGDTSETDRRKKQLIDSMPFPYNKIGGSSNKQIESSLSKIVMKLYSAILSTNNKYYIYGCIEALCLLSNEHPCTLYRKSWCDYHNFKHSEVDVSVTYSAEDLFTLCVDLLNNSIHIYDLSFTNNLMNLAANLYAGHATALLKPVDILETNQTWSMIPASSIKPLSDQYLQHTVRVLNIFHRVINDLVVVVPQSKTVLSHLPSTGTLSPIKRRKSEDKKPPITPGRIVMEKDEKPERRDIVKGVQIGYFAGSQHYVKLYEVLRNAFVNYKSSLDPKDSENFLELMRKTLQTLSVILEVATLNEFGRISEEILTYLRSTFALDSTKTVQCVQQLLKCLFGSNLTWHVAEILGEPRKKKENESTSFYYNIFQKPWGDMVACVNSLKSINKIECDRDSTIMGYLRKNDIKKPLGINRVSDKILASYINILEPMVIKSLREYTITSNVKLQHRVLQLLSQLVRLRVNYCLLDPEQVFKNFVLKQVEYIEAGQVPHSEVLIPQIFQFLVCLSYPEHHSKSIISVPKILHLCDGLMASGQDPKTHCIPALGSIVQDVFLMRNRSNTSDTKELETTREVMLSMMLRLIEYREVIDLLTLVLEDSKYCIDDTDKWFRWSGQVVTVFLQMLKTNKIKIENRGTFCSLKKFVFALNPNVFKPGDELVIMLFQAPPSLDDKIILNRWISKIILLLLILSPLKEDALIGKINKLKSEFSPGCVFENFTTTADPLNVYNNSDAFADIAGEEIIARMMFRIVTMISQEILRVARTKSNVFLVNQFNVLLMYCLHVFQTGSLCKVSQVFTALLTKKLRSDVKIEALNSTFLEIGKWYPTVAFQWCHMLSLLNYNDLAFWSEIITPREGCSIQDCIVNTGSTILFCDYLNENISETKQLSWNLAQNSDLLVDLIDEIPVSEFITFIHRNATLSKLLIQSIAQTNPGDQKPMFKIRVLKCVENNHSSQTGAVIKVLIPKMLNNRQIALSRMVANLASRKVEYLFTLSVEEVHNQLSKEDLFIIKEELNMMDLSKKYQTLINLFDKLLVQYYDMSPLEFNKPRNVNPEHIKKLSINKRWFLSQIQAKYQDGKLRKETARAMEKLEYTELVSFMTTDDFNKLLLRDCLEVGLEALQDKGLDQEPPILKASVDSILKEVNLVVNTTCANHEVFQMGQNYTIQICKVFQNGNFASLLLNLNVSLLTMMRALPTLPTLQLSEVDSENLSKFAVVSLEYVRFMIADWHYVNINVLDVFANCANEILKQSQFSGYLGLDTNLSWLCSAINVIHELVEYLVKDDETLPVVETVLSHREDEPAESCQALYTLVQWLYKNQGERVQITKFLLCPIRSLVLSLSRLRLVNSLTLIPSRVWALGWEPQLSGKFSTNIPPLPIDMLQEIDVLEEYIFRVTLLGWTTRQQFEETWMCFLSVLCTPLDNADSVDATSALHACSSAIKAITALLLQTMMLPVLGNKNVSTMCHVSRHTEIPNGAISIKKLRVVQDQIERKYNELSIQSRMCAIRNVFSNKNFEKVSELYSYGQISIKYFLISTNPESQAEDSFTDRVYRARTKILEDTGLDVNSCLQFLQDYYTQLLKTESAITDLRILHETVRSTLFMSDLFTDKSQFSWMLDMFLDLAKIHCTEDELLHQYLIVGICKAVGVLTPDIEIYEQAKKILVQFLKSSFIPARISCLYGLLYILEGCVLTNISIGGISEELQLMLPCAVEYIQQNLNTTNAVLKKCQEHTLLLWSLTFYLIENVDEVHMETNFVSNMLRAAFATVRSGTAKNVVQVEIIKSLERLLLIKPIYMLEQCGKHIQKLALEKMKDENPSTSILGVQLLISHMYVDCWEHLEKLEPENEQSNPDHLVQTIEILSAIFERIKKSYAAEVEILCSVLPIILKDFFSPSDILTKVIGEFLSPQQPHLKLMSGVVFQVFETAIQQNQLSLLQDWVVFSLSNFTQSVSNTANTWCLTCFFISASSNEWLRAFFPYVQTRVGRYEYEDKKIFCIAGADFYRNLTNDKQRQTFVDNFVKVKDQLDMPFSDLLNSL